MSEGLVGRNSPVAAAGLMAVSPWLRDASAGCSSSLLVESSGVAARARCCSPARGVVAWADCSSCPAVFVPSATFARRERFLWSLLSAMLGLSFEVGCVFESVGVWRLLLLVLL